MTITQMTKLARAWQPRRTPNPIQANRRWISTAQGLEREAQFAEEEGRHAHAKVCREKAASFLELASQALNPRRE